MNGWSTKQTAALAIVTVALLAGLVVERVRNRQPAPAAEFALERIPETGAKAPPGAAVGTAEREEAGGGQPPARLVVHVAGAVARPGVVELPRGARVIDAVRAAGGARPSADTDAVNLAAPVEDGEQIMLPEKGQSPSATADRGARTPGAVRNTQHRASAAPAGERPAKLTHPGEGTVNINTATEAELQRLPGVGPAMAARIATLRREHGRFAAPEQLLDVSGIGERTLERMKPFVRVR
ncbi:MAG TPA: helix-hairpin-helix domain-containing protein [Chthonomonadales bacterium]|nr:helix-hairpin-helix domain-containing protein [Chthonomonadales bacterium]